MPISLYRCDEDRDHTKLGAVSRLFPKEREFQLHLYRLLRKAGYSLDLERGWNIVGLTQRWDIGIRTNDWLRHLYVAIECKVKCDSDSLTKALGQCLLYRTTKCCYHSMLCVPSDLTIHPMVMIACEDNEIAIANEKNLLDVVEPLIKSTPISQIKRKRANVD